MQRHENVAYPYIPYSLYLTMISNGKNITYSYFLFVVFVSHRVEFKMALIYFVF